MIRGNNYTFTTSKASHSFECFGNRKDFLTPDRGGCSPQTGQGFSFFDIWGYDREVVAVKRPHICSTVIS